MTEGKRRAAGLHVGGLDWVGRCGGESKARDSAASMRTDSSLMRWASCLEVEHEQCATGHAGTQITPSRAKNH